VKVRTMNVFHRISEKNISSSIHGWKNEKWTEAHVGKCAFFEIGDNQG
jgi:hypothetical protein